MSLILERSSIVHAPTPPVTSDRIRRRLRKDPAAQARLVWFGLTVVVNALIALLAASVGRVVDHAVEASLLVFCVSIGARHDGLVRVAFATGRRIRSYRLHQLTYHLGQLHRAMAIAGTAWFVVAVGVAAGSGDGPGRAIGLAVLVVLVTMTWTARNAVRHSHHNRFERVHRYGGWTAVAILVVLVIRQVARSMPPGAGIVDVVRAPAVLLLVVVVALVVHPWIGVKRLPCEVVGVTDDVVVLALPGERSLGEYVRVSREGKEWHAFAVATTGSEGPGRFSLVIRRAGDWTAKLGRDAAAGNGPTHLLVRRMRGYGFMYHAQTYERVLFVATGAGIGPVLPYLVDQTSVDYECLWVGRNHRETIGDELVGRVLESGRVTLIDSESGRPDIGRCVADVAERFQAVFIVSNAHVRDEVARVCERLGVPWYGPTFDS
jgi:ferredoxin-NADP reductase